MTRRAIFYRSSFFVLEGRDVVDARDTIPIVRSLDGQSRCSINRRQLPCMLDYEIVGEGDATLNISEQLVQDTILGLPPLTPSVGTATLTATAIPEPSSAALLVLGASGIFARRRRS